jgi:hypothetical protein
VAFGAPFDLDQDGIRPTVSLRGVMIGWFARALLLAAGFVVSWFIASDSPQFGVMQMAVSLVLLVFIVAVLAFWPTSWSLWLERRFDKWP